MQQLQSLPYLNLRIDVLCFAATAYTSLASVLLSAQNVTSLVDQDKVARELGVNTDKDDLTAVASRKEADTMKAALIDAYSAASSAILDRIKLLSSEIEGKGECPTTSVPVGIPVQDPSKGSGETSSSTNTEAVAALPVPSSSASSPPFSLLPEPGTVAKVTPRMTDLVEKRTQAQKEFDAECKQLQRWDDLNSDKHWLLCINRLKLKNHWGHALKKINDLASSSADNKSKGEPVSREILYEVHDPTNCQ